MPVYLLTIRGTLASPSLEGSRAIHNSTAGAPANVAAARGLGDLSHMVNVPAHGSNGQDFLIMDLWNKLDGLNQFFANPHVQEQAGQIFTARDPVVWAPAEGFAGYHFPAPFGKNDRIVALVRGTVASREMAREAHNAIVTAQVNAARKAGDLSHDAYFRLAPPGTPEALEFLAVDVWMDAQGMAAYYQDPEFLKAADTLFAGPPVASTWVHPAGDWVEW
jgi:hypothetical protein